jgi:hypothetical protein
MTRQELPSPPAANDEVRVNENFEALDYLSIFARDDTTTSGLTWGYLGGRYDASTTVTAGTVTLTNTATNYVVFHRTTAVVSVSTASTNWDDTATYGRLYKLTVAGGVVTATEDHRLRGLIGAAAGGGTGDVVGPASSVDAEIALFDSTTGKLIKRATGTGYAKVTSGVLSADSTATVQAAMQGAGLDVDACGFRGIPQNAQTGNYTLVAADAGKHIYHASGAGAGDTYTIPANGSVAYEIGTSITFVNMDSNALSIAITTDTMNLAGTGTTGTRSLAQYGVATAVKIDSTAWIISGTGLT